MQGLTSINRDGFHFQILTNRNRDMSTRGSSDGQSIQSFGSSSPRLFDRMNMVCVKTNCSLNTQHSVQIEI